jgi:plasmid stabilization system protein ParE
VRPRVIFRPAADRDIDGAFSWYERQQVGLGNQFLTSLNNSVEMIRASPESYAVVRHFHSSRRVASFPVSGFYVVEPDRIVVLACLHASRDPEAWPS